MEYIDQIIDKIREARKSEDISKGIELCRQGIRHTSRDEFKAWHVLKFNLAALLMHPESGIPSEDFEEAIEIFNELLDAISKSEHPHKWATCHRGLALVFDERILGAKNTNLLTAMEHCELALSVFSRNDYPEDWASFKSLQASFLSKLTSGNKIENIARSVEINVEILDVWTKEDFPEDYEDTIEELARLKNILDDEAAWQEIRSRIDRKYGKIDVIDDNLLVKFQSKTNHF